MKIVVLANEAQQSVLLAKPVSPEVTIHWIPDLEALKEHEATDALFDLLFEPDAGRMALLSAASPAVLLVNSVAWTSDRIKQIHPTGLCPIVRISGWNGFLDRPIWEIATDNTDLKEKSAAVLTAMGLDFQWCPDVPGMIAARVIAMIINEAYFALGEEVSTKAEIDIAMKTGTNYPYGPFEWAEKIGCQHIFNLLSTLAKEDERYAVAPALLNEINNR
jgi:3-hydroxybutyryl-CoA dehydrogenase